MAKATQTIEKKTTTKKTIIGGGTITCPKCARASQRETSPRRSRGSTSAMCCSTVRQGSSRFS